MKKRGFTLIELLAVIVVLAIIALIATPIVMNTIKKSQKGAAERSADNYIEAVETAVATARLDSDGIPDGTYTINDKGNLTGNGLTEPLVIEMNGNKPTSGTIKISNGQVTTDSKMTVGSYEVAYNSANKKYEATEKDSSSSTVVYRWSTDRIKIGDTIDSSDTSKFTKDASTLGKNNYLKHVLDKDSKVTETYVCVDVNNKEYCLTNGEYGYAENEADYTGNALVLKNYHSEDFICRNFNEFGCGCENGDDDSIIGLTSYSDGYVKSEDRNTNSYCYSYDNDASYCEN